MKMHPSKKSDPTFDEYLASLGSVSHFSGLPREQLEMILNSGSIVTFPAHSTIYYEEEPCAGLFVLLSGKVHLMKHSAQGQEYIVAVIDPVIMFNEVAVLDGKDNPVSAIAVQKATLWYTSCRNFQVLLTRIPEVSLGLLKVMARRNRLLLSRFEDLSTRSILERTAKLLLEISYNGSIVIQRGENPNRVMASRISTIPEAFSRALRYFKEQRYIDCTRTTISIKNPEKLAEISKIIFPLI